jgi:glycerol uptake facilitator-like aquaporin
MRYSEDRQPQLSDKGTRGFKFRFVGSIAAVVVVIVLAVGVFSKPRPTPLMMGILLVVALIAVAWTSGGIHGLSQTKSLTRETALWCVDVQRKRESHSMPLRT